MLSQAQIGAYFDQANLDPIAIEEILSTYCVHKYLKGADSARVLVKIKHLVTYLRATGRVAVLQAGREQFRVIAMEVSLGGGRLGIIPTSTPAGKAAVNELRRFAAQTGQPLPTDPVLGGPFPLTGLLSPRQSEGVDNPFIGMRIFPDGSQGRGGGSGSSSGGVGVGVGLAEGLRVSNTPSGTSSTSQAQAQAQATTSTTASTPNQTQTQTQAQTQARPQRQRDTWAEEYFILRRRYSGLTEEVPGYSYHTDDSEIDGRGRGTLPRYHGQGLGAGSVILERGPVESYFSETRSGSGITRSRTLEPEYGESLALGSVSRNGVGVGVGSDTVSGARGEGLALSDEVVGGLLGIENALAVV